MHNLPNEPAQMVAEQDSEVTSKKAILLRATKGRGKL